LVNIEAPDANLMGSALALAGVLYQASAYQTGEPSADGFGVKLGHVGKGWNRRPSAVVFVGAMGERNQHGLGVRIAAILAKCPLGGLKRQRRPSLVERPPRWLLRL
jgi:hypothetical protein